MCQIHREDVWSLAHTSLNVKVKGQGHLGQKMPCALPSPPAATEWNALAANNIIQQQQTGPFHHAGDDFGGLRVVCV